MTLSMINMDAIHKYYRQMDQAGQNIYRCTFSFGLVQYGR